MLFWNFTDINVKDDEKTRSKHFLVFQICTPKIERKKVTK